MNTFQKLVFVDLETTGANPADDRITEIGIVRIDNGEVTQWSSLVNPQTAIPPFIQNLTGITDDMVIDAPLFESLAEQLWEQLDGALFIAHNARFDHGFLKNAFKRIGKDLRCEVLCTVKLSRKLYPDEVKHNLGSLIERHQLTAAARHRALADADVLWQFWQKLHREIPEETLHKTLHGLLNARQTSGSLPPDALQEISNVCGVYQFFDEKDALLYVSKSAHMRRHAQAHFNGNIKNPPFANQVKRVVWHENAGEVGAALLEAKLIRDLQPQHNRTQREDSLCAWQLRANLSGMTRPVLVKSTSQNFARADDLYGLFKSKKKAEAHLRELAKDEKLCLIALGLETQEKAFAPCIAYKAQRCRGACLDEESAAAHLSRVKKALSNSRIQQWPYPGAIILGEISADGKRQEFHGVNNWCYLGSADSEDELRDLIGNASSQDVVFELETYKILQRPLALELLRVYLY